MYKNRITKAQVSNYCLSVLRNHKLKDTLSCTEFEILKTLAYHKFHKEIIEIFVGQPFWYNNDIICTKDNKCFFARFKDNSTPDNFSIPKTLKRMTIDEVDKEFRKYFN